MFGYCITLSPYFPELLLESEKDTAVSRSYRRHHNFPTIESYFFLNNGKISYNLFQIIPIYQFCILETLAEPRLAIQGVTTLLITLKPDAKDRQPWQQFEVDYTICIYGIPYAVLPDLGAPRK